VHHYLYHKTYLVLPHLFVKYHDQETGRWSFQSSSKAVTCNLFNQ